MDSSATSGQIDRILRSRSFANKGQLRKLLEVLYKNMDSPTALSPDLVIKELWPAETRTKRSADVATEMNRLRHALEAYYQTEGKGDPIIIVLPNRSVAVDGSPEKLSLQAGNAVVFSVGPGNGLQNTGLSATITKACALTDQPFSAPTGEITCSGRPARE